MMIDDALDAEVRLILDNLRVHHSNVVKAWVTAKFEQFELLNVDLNQEIGGKVPARTKAKLREAANENMTMLDKIPQRVIG